MIPYTNIHTHRPPTLEPKECIGISSFRLGYDSVLPPAPFSAGIHPWDATEACHRLPELLQQLKRCGAAAVGEIGLDHASGRRNESGQTTVLTAQLQSASALRLPVIIHCVKAFELLMELLAAYSLPAVIFHGYTGSPQQTERLFAAGYYLSVGPISLRSPKTEASLREAPLHRLFIETDDSDVPIEQMYTAVGALLNIPVPELKADIYQNFKTVFPDYGVA